MHSENQSTNQTLDWAEVSLETLGLSPEELCYSHPDGRYSTRYEHLEGGIFRTEISGVADLETVRGEWAIEDKVIESLQRHGLMYYQLCVLNPSFRITSELRYALKERAPEMEGKNGGMAFVGTTGLIRGVGHFVLFFFPKLRFSFHHDEREGLAQIRQWVRQDYMLEGKGSPFTILNSANSDQNKIGSFKKPIWQRIFPKKNHLPKSLTADFLFNDDPEGMIIISSQRRIQLFNPSFETLSGYQTTELQGEADTILFYRDDHELLEQEFTELLEYQKPRGDLPVRLLCRNGDVAPVRCFISTLQIETDLEGYLIRIQDLREVDELQQQFFLELKERKKMTKELEKAKTAAEEANRAKSRFLANMSHEFRTPLNSISGFTQIVLEDAHQLRLPEAIINNLRHIQTSSETLADLINHVLDFSKIDAGKMEIQNVVFNPVQLIRSIYHLHQTSARNKGVKFNYQVPAGVPLSLRSDRMKLHQIISNLVGNAIKFTPKGNSVFLKMEYTNDLMLLRIIDEGIGISEERLPEIFNAFTQADDSSTRHFGGTGLGLAITHELVNLLEGQISVSSRLGEGSTFMVELPVKEIRKTEPYPIMTDRNKIRFQRGNLVLVVEDIPKNREMICQVLERLGLNVSLAVDGEDGVRKAERLKPDLILMDLHLPGMDGLEAIRRIRQSPVSTEIPIISFSADAFKEQQLLAQEAGANDTLIKPLNTQILYSILNKYLKQSECGISDKNEPLPLPPSLETEICLKLKDIAQFQPYQSVQMVHLAEEILDLCHDYETHYLQAAEEIRNLVYSNQARRIPGYIEEILQTHC